jgi:hypothetical protein
MVAFSGGGTRAASLAYGVLQELADTEMMTAEGPRSLLNEIDMISSVSGGSFTSAYYGLYGDRLFGVGFNWGRPNEDTFGLKLEDQYTAEVFYRWDVMKGVQLTPSLQLMADPALNQEDDLIYVLGLRARVVF